MGPTPTMLYRPKEFKTTAALLLPTFLDASTYQHFQVSPRCAYTVPLDFTKPLTGDIVMLVAYICVA